MTFDVLSDLNWLAVLVAAVAYFVLGALWYARRSSARCGPTPAAALPKRGSRTSAAIYLTPLIGSVLSAIASG